MEKKDGMKEYGGYIELERFHGEEFHKTAIALNSGRHCVEYLVIAKKIKKLYLPYFLCDSVCGICDRLGVETEYYHIDMGLTPIFERTLRKDEWLYLVNYYGQLSNETIQGLKDEYHHIIVDNVQAFFQMPVSGVDTLYSCRKFFGVADGAYLYTDAVCDKLIEVDCSYDRMRFLLGRYEKEASLFYEEYRANNKMFKFMPMRWMSSLTHNLLCGIDYKHVGEQRDRNFEYLYKRFEAINLLRLKIPDGGYMYPLYIANGDSVRKQLLQKKIYIPTLWPNVFDICGKSNLEYDMARNILPLPVDQRYGQTDMEYIADEVERVMTTLKTRKAR